MSAARVTNLYDLMDAAYCSQEIREGHVPLIDHNPRKGEKIEFAPHEALRYSERTVAERSNARLKDEFGGNQVMVRKTTESARLQQKKSPCIGEYGCLGQF